MPYMQTYNYPPKHAQPSKACSSILKSIKSLSENSMLQIVYMKNAYIVRAMLYRTITKATETSKFFKIT